MRFAFGPAWARRRRRICCPGDRPPRGDATPLGLAHIDLADAAQATDETAGGPRIFQSVRRGRARRVAALRLLLPDGFPARAPAGARARGSGAAGHRASPTRPASRRITSPSSARSWPGWRRAPSKPTCRAGPVLRTSSRALGGAFFCRSGNDRGGAILQICWPGWPYFHGTRSGSVQAASLRRRASLLANHHEPEGTGYEHIRREADTGASTAAASSARAGAQLWLQPRQSRPARSPRWPCESDSERKKARYKETEHVKTFYRVNRY